MFWQFWAWFGNYLERRLSKAVCMAMNMACLVVSEKWAHKNHVWCLLLRNRHKKIKSRQKRNLCFQGFPWVQAKILLMWTKSNSKQSCCSNKYAKMMREVPLNSHQAPQSWAQWAPQSWAPKDLPHFGWGHGRQGWMAQSNLGLAACQCTNELY